MSTPDPAPINVFLDSDGPIANFDYNLLRSGVSCEVFKHAPGTYLWLPKTEFAEESISYLKLLDEAGRIRVWVLTKTPSSSPYAYTEKVLWYRQHFPWLEDRVIITHDKHLLGTTDDFLLDDRPYKANADKFRGTFVLFEPAKPKESWSMLLNVVQTAILARPN